MANLTCSSGYWRASQCCRIRPSRRPTVPMRLIVRPPHSAPLRRALWNDPVSLFLWGPSGKMAWLCCLPTVSSPFNRFLLHSFLESLKCRWVSRQWLCSHCFSRLCTYKTAYSRPRPSPQYRRSPIQTARSLSRAYRERMASQMVFASSFASRPRRNSAAS